MARDWAAVYRAQDAVLGCLAGVTHGFCLTGGTALARGYCQHRHSDDVDLFASDAVEFELWRDRCVEAIRGAAEARGQRVEILLREARFGRLVLFGEEPVKVEFVNDLPCRIGAPWVHPTLGRLDTRESILAHKLSAVVDREAPKDVADIFWLCCRDGLDILEALERAAAGGLEAVHWVEAPGAAELRQGIGELVGRLMG